MIAIPEQTVNFTILSPSERKKCKELTLPHEWLTIQKWN